MDTRRSVRVSSTRACAHLPAARLRAVMVGRGCRTRLEARPRPKARYEGQHRPGVRGTFARHRARKPFRLHHAPDARSPRALRRHGNEAVNACRSRLPLPRHEGELLVIVPLAPPGTCLSWISDCTKILRTAQTSSWGQDRYGADSWPVKGRARDPRRRLVRSRLPARGSADPCAPRDAGAGLVAIRSAPLTSPAFDGSSSSALQDARMLACAVST